VYGVDINATDTSRFRNNTEFNLTTGTQTKTVGGEAFPNRTFPKTKTTRVGIYVQDEIELANGRLSIIPSIRYDYYNLNPQPNDPDFIRIGGRVQDVKELTTNSVPKLQLPLNMRGDFGVHLMMMRRSLLLISPNSISRFLMPISNPKLAMALNWA
jgi:outer membrane receptor protein involved in Fe transport